MYHPRRVGENIITLFVQCVSCRYNIIMDGVDTGNQHCFLLSSCTIQWTKWNQMVVER